MDYRKHIDTTPELAQWYDDKYTEMGDGWNTPPEEVNKHLDDLGVQTDNRSELLDVGCGAGHFLREAEKRCLATGIEISEVGVELTRNRVGPTSRVIHGSIEDTYGLGPFDYIVSIGSLEHIVDLGTALDNIRHMLKPDGRFYFYCPNELWKHFDQPNERTMTDDEWVSLFATHGLYTHTAKRWNDSTAFIGGLKMIERPIGLNIGSGQRRFESGMVDWVNIDCVSRPPDQRPDLVVDVGREPLPFEDGSVSYCVLHQVYEHFGLGEGHGVIRECHRVLQPGGALIVTVPDMRALAQRWLTGQLEDYLYFVNVYGAYQGEPGDRHKWGYDKGSLEKDLHTASEWTHVMPFNWRHIPGADIARDWWILGMECVK